MMIEALKERIDGLKELNEMSNKMIELMERFIELSNTSENTNFELCRLYYDAIKEELAKDEHGELASGWGSMTINETLDELKNGLKIIEERWNK